MESTEVTQESSSTTTEVTADPIADIVKKYSIEETAQEFESKTTQESPQPQTKPDSSTVIPDPYDTENFRKYLADERANSSVLQSQVKALAGVVGRVAQERLQAKTDSDIQAAVKTVDDIVNLGKPKVIEAYLDGMVREDKRLAAIWSNRDKNPQALKEALKTVANKMAEDFSIKTDPKLVDAQRARKAAQSTNATTQEENPDEKIAAQIEKAGSFDRFWDSLKGAQN